MPENPTIGAFLRAFGARWFTLMSGPLTVPFAAAALFAPQTWQRQLFAVLAILCCAVSSYGIWANERTQRNAAEKKIYDGQQPDVALVWDWMEDVRRNKELLGQTEKDILVENRSNQHIYNVRIEPVKLKQELTFDLINEIPPSKQHRTVARWDGRSSTQTNYIYFFSENEKEIAEKGWYYKKTHHRDINDHFVQMPMAVTYEDSKGMKWRVEFDFQYDSTESGCFIRRSGGRA